MVKKKGEGHFYMYGAKERNLRKFKEEYGPEKGERIFYATYANIKKKKKGN